VALAHERSRGEDRALLERFLHSSALGDWEAVRRLLRDEAVEGRCRGLLESYKEEAVRALADLENASLKGLLRRVIGKIFSVEIKGWCSEFEARNAAGRAAREEPPR
jgi:hypothetical protein